MHRPSSPFGAISVLSFSFACLLSCSSGGGGGGGTPVGVGPGGVGTATLSLSPESGTVGTLVLITGEGFSLIATENKIEFSGGVASLAEVSTATTLLTRVPNGATSGPIKVAVNETTKLSPKFLVLPSITGVSPAKMTVTGIFSIQGSGFDVDDIPNNRVTISGADAPVTDATPTFLNVQVPVGALSGPVEVTVGGVKAIGSASIIVPPLITSFTPDEGLIGTPVTIQGFGFSDNESANAVKFNSVQATVISSDYFSIETSVPPGTSTGKITVTVSGETATSAVDFVVNLPPVVTGFNPGNAVKGALITVLGQNFNGTPSNNQVSFGTHPATVQSATPTALGVIVPSSIPDQTPPLFITVTTSAGSATTPLPFEVDYPPVITDFFPKTATAGSPIAISGANFFTTPGSNTVTVGGLAATVLSASLNSLVVSAPQTPVGGAIQVTTPDGSATSAGLFQTVFPRFAFVTNSGDQTMNFFVVDSATGKLRHNGFRFVGASKAPRGLAASPDGQMLYVAHFGAAEVAQYQIGTNGVPEPFSVATVATGNGPTAIAIHPSGSFAFVLNQTGGTISQYTIQSGSLVVQPGTTISTGGSTPTSLAIDAAGNNLYATNVVAGTVAMFSIGADGLLTSLGTVGAGAGTALQTGPAAVLLHPNGKFAYVANSNTNLIYLFSVTNGVLTPVLDGSSNQITIAAGTRPESLAFDPTAAFLYAANRTTNDVSIFQVNSTSGILTAAGSLTLPSVGATAPSPVALTSYNGNLYALGNATTEVIQLSINTTSGQLANANQVRVRTTPLGIAFSNGTVASKMSTLSVHTANNVGLDTEVFSMDTGGILTSIGVAGSAAGGTAPPVWVGIHPFGKFYYLGLLGSTAVNGTLGYGTLDPFSGAASTFTPIQITSGTAPNQAFYNAKAIEVDKSGRFTISIGEKFSANPATSHMLTVVIDQSTGGFASGTFSNLIPAAGKAQSLFLDPSGRFAYVANPGASTVQGLAINGNSGALTNAQAGLSVGAGTFPYAVTMHSSGRFAYVAYGQGTSAQVDSVRTYLVGTTGQLTMQQDAALGALPHTGSGSSIVVDPLGRFLFLILANGSIQTWTIASNGTLSGPITNTLPEIFGNTPHSLATDLSGAYLFVANSADTVAGNNVVTCSIQANGALTVASETTGVLGTVPMGIAVNRKVE